MENNALKLALYAESTPTIRAGGELNYTNCAHLGNLVHEAFNLGCPTVNLDLELLDFVDSSGLRVLVLAADEARKAGRSLRVVSMSSQLNHLLDISGFRRLFEIAVTSAPGDRPAPERPSLEETCFRLPAEISACREARDSVAQFASGAGCKCAELDDIKLAVGEAVSNAVRYGNCDDGPISVGCRTEGGRLLVTLRYASPVFDPAKVPLPDLSAPAEGGMGIYFMRLVMDEVTYDFNDGFATVTLAKQLDGESRRGRAIPQLTAG